MKKNYLLCCFSFLIVVGYGQTPSRPTVKIFRPDLSFTCITVDSANRVWAGTNGNGFVRIANDQPMQIKIAANNFGTVNIKDMAADKAKGIWVAHEGYGAATYGGIDYLDADNPVNRKHYTSVSRLVTIFKGFPSRRTESIAIDKNGKVWSAHSYHDLTVPGGNPYYVVNPGGMGFKTPAMLTFDTIPAGLEPYPAYTINTPITESAGTRVCPSVAVDNVHNEVWLGGASYNALPVYQGSRISRWNLAGTYLGQFDETNSPLPLGNNGNARPIAIYFDNAGNGWVGFNLAKGFAVKTDTGWTYIGLPSILPAGTNINQNAIGGNKKGEVFIGTTAGLLKYRGVGSYTSDTSYVLYTAASNGLPSDNITGVTVDKGGIIWMSTTAGICKMFTSDLIMYNLKPTFGSYITESDELRRVVAYFGADTQNTDTIRIAADGSRVTLFKWHGSNPDNLKLRIKEDPDGNNPDEYGRFILIYRDPAANDSIKVQYTHPKFVDDLYTVSAPGGREVTLEVVDTTVDPQMVVLSQKIRFVLPPVLMLHGLWSDGSSFKEMKNYLLNNGIYKYKDFQVSAPSYTNDVSYEENKDVAMYAANDLLEQCANNKMSAGKVDIVAHSMGGILSRVFLQSDYYENTIHKLITLNTPHSGSQAANVIMNNPVVFKSLKYINSDIKNIGFDPSRGAVADLQVNSDATLQLLNGASLNKNVVPSHAIVTKDESIKNDELKLWLKGIALDAVSLALGKKTPYKTALMVVVKEIATLNTSCSLFELIHTCMKDKLFHDDNDWIVAMKSQEGGLPETAISRFDNLMHTQVEGNVNVFFRVHDLLRKKDDDPAFSIDGYHPPTLSYDGLLNRPSSISAETIHINNPIAGATFTAGQTINIDISGSTDVNTLMYLAGNASLGIYSDDTTLQNHIFSYTIPKDALGRINIFAIGFDSQGKTTADSSFINVSLPDNVSLDSLRAGDRNIKMFKGDSIAIPVTGYFSDTARDISGISGIIYSFDEMNAAASAPNYIKGINVGFDRMTITYNGKADTVYIEVIDKPAGSPTVLPVLLSSFKGRLQGNVIQLTWTTAQELNNHYFEIERSFDGAHFEKIGQVTAKGSGNSGNTYTFNDGSLKTGSNFYRLKQVDINGHYMFSDVLLINVASDNSSLSIHPNPAKDNVNILLAQEIKSDWQINIYNSLGELLLAKQMLRSQKQSVLNITNFSKGVYYLVLREKDGTFINSGKLIKE